MKLKFSRTLIYLFLFMGAALMVLPFYWMISGAFKTSAEITRRYGCLPALIWITLSLPLKQPPLRLILSILSSSLFAAWYAADSQRLWLPLHSQDCSFPAVISYFHFCSH